MKKTIKFTVIFFFAFFAFFACNGGDTHTHSWDSAWVKDATGHWKACSCGEKTQFAAHSGNPCTVCGYDDGSSAQTWTAVTNSTFGTSMVNSVAWGTPTGGGVFVAVGAAGKMAYSADGISWTAVTGSPFGTNAVNCVAWGGTAGSEKFMAVGAGGIMASSDDGITWAAVANSGFGTNEINGITWGGGSGANKWVAVGRNRIAYSNAEGTSWTGFDSNAPFNYQQGSPNLLDVAYSGSRFVLVGPAGGQGHGASLAHSADGITWERVVSEGLGGQEITSVCSDGGTFVAVSMSYILYSANGTAWAAKDMLTLNRQLLGAGYGNGKFAIVGQSGTVLFSEDGENWETQANSLSSHFKAVAYGNGTWVVTGLNGAMAYCVE